jgi:hypothetical protein
MTTKREKIKSKALALIKSTPEGIRYSELIRKIHEEYLDIPINTISGTIWNLDTQEPNEVYKPARGLFRHILFKEKEIKEEQETGEREKATHTVLERINEEDFYQPFAEWLVNELEECTKAIPLGGNKFKDKWGTPDVIGVREPKRSDIIKSSTEIVSAEIKTDTKDLITAFGQSCSYRLFSHKSYIVVPKSSSEEDISKLDALGLIFGIGLVLFDNSNVNNPQFEIRVRSLKHEPDMFYVNKYLRLLEQELF